MLCLHHAPRHLFFTGKGGVGKTSLACACALWLAEHGRRVLLVSTDPASNVGQVFGVSIGNQITALPAAPGLSALEIDPPAAAAAYRERMLAPVRGVLPDAVVAGIAEQLSGACTTEIAAFDEFTALLTDGALTAGFDHIPPPATPSACCNCPAPGASFSTTPTATPPAWGRWRRWTNSASNTRRRWPR